MKILKTPLGLIAIMYLVYGIVMNIRMFTEKMWPTYLFFISIGIGILFLGINKVTKRLPNYRIWQVVIGISPIIVFLIHIQIYNNKTDTKSISEVIETNEILLTESKLGNLSLDILNERNLKNNINSIFQDFQIVKSVGQQDGPDFNLYKVTKLEQEIFFISMDSYDTIIVKNLWIKNKIIKDEYGIFVGQTMDSVLKKRPKLTFHSDLHYNIYATEENSKIEYRLIGNFKKLNDTKFVLPDYSIEKWQIKGMTIEYLIWRK